MTADTLAWSAAALSFLLRGVPVPVVLTGADRPLEEPASNGPANLRAAVGFALAERLPGVFGCWANPGEDAAIHLGTRILPADPHTDIFRPAGGFPFGTLDVRGFHRDPHPRNPSRSGLAERADPDRWKLSLAGLGDGPQFEDAVLVLPGHPGLDHSPLLRGLERWKAVVQVAHHSGTASSTEGPGSFLEFAAAARANGVPVFLGPAGRLPPYSSRHRLEREGVRPCPDCAWPSLVVKIRHLLARRTPELLDRDLAWEILSGGPGVAS